MANSDNKINIGDAWKDIDNIQINIGDSWKDVDEAYINIGDSWKQFWSSTPALDCQYATADPGPMFLVVQYKTNYTFFWNGANIGSNSTGNPITTGGYTYSRGTLVSANFWYICRQAV